MRNTRILILFSFVLCSFASYSTTVTQGSTAYRSFWHPTFLGQALDYCTVDGKECGTPVAKRYCQMLGYDDSSQSIIAYNVGLTHFIATRAQCTGWRCNGFMTIACTKVISHKPPKSYHYREKQFAYPRYSNVRVDWCYNHYEQCGKRAADSFCSRMGFMQAMRFLKEAKVAATKTIGSQELCFGNECEAFKLIVCSR